MPLSRGKFEEVGEPVVSSRTENILEANQDKAYSVTELCQDKGTNVNTVLRQLAQLYEEGKVDCRVVKAMQEQLYFRYKEE